MSDTQWLKGLYDEHYGMLYRLAARRLRAGVGHTDDAEDVLQEVFLLALRQNICVHPCPAGWLLKTTELVCQNWIRKSRTRNARRVPEGGEGAESLTGTADSACAYSASEALLTAEQSLSGEDWQLLKDYTLEEAAPDELASRRGKTVNALRVQISRLRSRVRRDCREP